LVQGKQIGSIPIPFYRSTTHQNRSSIIIVVMRLTSVTYCIRLCMILGWAAWLFFVARFFHASNVIRNVLYNRRSVSSLRNHHLQGPKPNSPLKQPQQSQKQPQQPLIPSKDQIKVETTSLSSSSTTIQNQTVNQKIDASSTETIVATTSTFFEPDSLDMERHDTIAKCWTGSPRPQEQRITSSQHCLYSSQYQLSASLSGKTGTSTQKRVLESTMNAKEIPCQSIPNDDGLIQVATVREPLGRFIS